MATITTIQGDDLISDSRSDINTNFANLNSDKIETSYLDTDTTLSANSDTKIPTQKAVKAYVDAGGNPNASTTQAGIVEEATQAELTSGSTTGGSGARLFINPVNTVSTSSGSSDEGKLPRLNNSGVIDISFLPTSMLNSKTYSFIEDVNGTTTPKAVCINADGYVQTADANVTNLDKFIGFVNTNVAPGVVSPFVNNSSGTSSTVSFTPGAGTNKVLIVSIGLYRNLSNIVLPSGVTFNGVAMTLVDTLNPDSTPGDTWGQAIYALAIGSSTTTANVVVSGASYDNIVVQAACYSGVDQTTPVLIKGKATGTSATPSVTIDPTSGYCRVVNTIINNTSRTVSSWNDGQTQRDSDDIAFGSYYISISDTTNTNGASNAYDATLSGSATWGIQAFELKPSTPTVTGSVLFQGSLSGFSGLTPNAKYYLSNTAGEISTTPGSTSVLLAKALSATEIVIIQN